MGMSTMIIVSYLGFIVYGITAATVGLWVRRYGRRHGWEQMDYQLASVLVAIFWPVIAATLGFVLLFLRIGKLIVKEEVE